MPKWGFSVPWRGEIGALRSCGIGTGFILLSSAACAHPRSGSYVIAGAFFPSWLICGVIGTIVAVLTRILISAFGLSHFVAYQLCVCVSVGAIAAMLLWLYVFGPTT